MRVLRLIRRYRGTVIVTGWLVFLTYSVASGKIEPATAFEKLTSSEFVALIFGLM